MEYTTKALHIRPFLPGDREAMAALLMDKIVAKTYMLPDFACAAEAEKMFDRLMELSARNDRFICAICAPRSSPGCPCPIRSGMH